MASLGVTARMWCVVLTVAALAALIETIGMDNRWSWAALAAATARNVVVAAVVAILAEATQTRRGAEVATPPAPQTQIDIEFGRPTGHIEVPRHGSQTNFDDWVTLVRQEVAELTTLADHVYGVLELSGHESEVTEEAFVRLDDLRWLLGNYVLKGGRIRRLVQLPDLVMPTETIRGAAEDLLQRIKDTNVATIDWLIVHRVALPDLDFLDTNALLGRYRRLEVEPTSISGDPLYLLTCHIHDILETVESLGDMDHPVLDVLETQLSEVLASVGDEITSAQAFDAALVALARTGRSAEAA